MYKVWNKCLLQDEYGEEIRLIKRNINKGAESITRTIYHTEMADKCMAHLATYTCTYQHLMECLRQSELGVLAN